MIIHTCGFLCKRDRAVEHRAADDDRVGARRRRPRRRRRPIPRPRRPGAGRARRRARSAAGRGRGRGRCRPDRSRSPGSRARRRPSGGRRTRPPRRPCPRASRACARGRRGSRARRRPGPSRRRAGRRASGADAASVPTITRSASPSSAARICAPVRRPPPSCTRRPGTARSRRSRRACAARALARAGGVEVDHVQPRRARRGIALGERDRIDREGGDAVVAALVQPHDLAAEQVDGRDRPARAAGRSAHHRVLAC